MNNLLRASLFHYKAKEAEAVAVLETYCNKGVGVPDHSNLVGEVNEWIKTLSESQDAITVLERLLNQAAQQVQEVQQSGNIQTPEGG